MCEDECIRHSKRVYFQKILRIRLILPDLTAIGLILSHASHCASKADGSVTRSQPNLRTGITSGN